VGNFDTHQIHVDYNSRFQHSPNNFSEMDFDFRIHRSFGFVDRDYLCNSQSLVHPIFVVGLVVETLAIDYNCLFVDYVVLVQHYIRNIVAAACAWLFWFLHPLSGVVKNVSLVHGFAKETDELLLEQIHPDTMDDPYFALHSGLHRVNFGNHCLVVPHTWLVLVVGMVGVYALMLDLECLILCLSDQNRQMDSCLGLLLVLSH
jgi:hypothetical protein